MAGRWIWVVGLAATLLFATGSVATAELTDTGTDEDVIGTWEPIVLDDDVVEEAEELSVDLSAEAAEDGAIARHTKCLIENRLFRRVVSTGGHVVYTPSGNATLVCHARITPKVLRGRAPSEAIVLDDVPCFDRRTRFRNSHLVLTPSLELTLVCHINPSG